MHHHTGKRVVTVSLSGNDGHQGVEQGTFCADAKMYRHCQQLPRPAFVQQVSHHWEFFDRNTLAPRCVKVKLLKRVAFCINLKLISRAKPNSYSVTIIGDFEGRGGIVKRQCG